MRGVRRREEACGFGRVRTPAAPLAQTGRNVIAWALSALSSLGPRRGPEPATAHGGQVKKRESTRSMAAGVP
jgi:hypothetical protein